MVGGKKMVDMRGATSRKREERGERREPWGVGR